MPINRFVAFLSLAVLTGCQTGGVGMVGSPMWHATASQQDKVSVYRDICSSYGFQVNTPEMAQCIATESRGSRQNATNTIQRLNANNQRRNTTYSCREINGIVTCNSW